MWEWMCEEWGLIGIESGRMIKRVDQNLKVV